VYEAPRADDPTPRAVGLFRIYASALASAYVITAGVLVVLALREVSLGTAATPLALSLLALGALHAVAALAPRVPWGWTLATVVLVLGTVSCLLPLALPHHVAWQKPLVKAAYRSV
jgi:hypothetical protein